LDGMGEGTMPDSLSSQTLNERDDFAACHRSLLAKCVDQSIEDVPMIVEYKSRFCLRRSE
jgi:hypothetical protein